MPKYKRNNFKIKTDWVILGLTLTIFMAWLNLKGFSGFRVPLQLLFAIVISGFLSFALTRILDVNSISIQVRYRTAFFISLLINLCMTLIPCALVKDEFNWRLLLIMISASFAGNFFAAIMERGWMENNAPPSKQIEIEVFNWHQSIMESKINRIPGKRFFDIIFGFLALFLSAPLWMLISILIWWEDPGPLFFVKNAVGKGGKNFKQFKFRSMILDAEKDTGPISGYENDERVLFFGKILRKTALDELPQLINILKGDMSWVGPRPQRTVLVHRYLQNLPEYAQRHHIRPGLAGLAQVTDSYDITPDEKLAWDLVYIEKASLWVDIKLLLSAFYLVFALRWLPETNPELKIRSLLQVEKPQ